jgi:hypothetical protein
VKRGSRRASSHSVGGRRTAESPRRVGKPEYAPDDTVAIYPEDSKALFEEINPGSKIDGTILV